MSQTGPSGAAPAAVPAAAPAWELAQLLSEPHRREVYRVVRQARRPLTRDEVSRATGINRRLTAFHLDRLAAAGFLDTDYARPEGRLGGPGSGRPAKRYTASGIEVELSVPARHYVFAARLLARAVSDRPDDAAAASYDVARAEGRRIGEANRPPSARRARAAVVTALDDLGYEPVDDGKPAIRLRNCPFRAVADVAPGLVCGMNRELVAGILEGAGVAGDAELGGEAPDCCVIAVLSR
ncbi:MAG TPA: ArsR family transcriptional regulator [Mycobacteriales bacterium]|nr:ArsR family transcriptional regulator [Mycobacteriales bacterium]